MNHRSFATSLIAGAALLAASGGVLAQSTWNVYNGLSNNSGCSQAATNSGNFNNSYNCTTGTGAGTQSMTVTGWSSNSDRGVSGGIRGTVNTTSTNTSTFYGSSYYLSGSGFASSLLSDQGASGLGGTSRLEAQTARANGDTTPLDPASPNHAFDSVAPGAFDMLLLDFGSSNVILDKIGIGWKGADADLMVMRWTGTTAPTRTTGTTGSGGNQNLTDTLWSAANPTVAGWQLVGTYGNLGTDSTAPFGGAAVNTGATQASSWWLVSAFNTTLLGSNTACSTCDAGNDSFKFNFIQTRTPGVPEPGTAALAVLALGGAVAARRRVSRR